MKKQQQQQQKKQYQDYKTFFESTKMGLKKLYFSKLIPGVILGQNCIRLSDTALNDLFFSKICFIKSSINIL